MNKLMGLYELKHMQLPTIQWKVFTDETKLDDGMLWTIRSAVYRGSDLNLPRKVGVNSLDAMNFAIELCKAMKDDGIVIYYPYFVAIKSGTIEVAAEKIVIEAVKADLWNLVSGSKKDVTYWITGDEEKTDGDKDFLTEREKKDLLRYVKEIKRIFRSDLFEGKSVLLEWSIAQNCDLERKPLGEEYLVFYEMRSL